MSVAEIHHRRQLERGVESSQCIDCRIAFKHIVAARVAHHVLDSCRAGGEQIHVTAFAVTHSANPAFDVNLFAGAIHLAIVEDKPPQRIAPLSSDPAAAIVPPVIVLWEDRNVAAFAGYEHPGRSEHVSLSGCQVQG